MIPDGKELDTVELFLQVLLVGEIFIPHGWDAMKNNLSEILRHCGVTLTKSDFMILDQSRIGNSTITIAKYSLDYEQEGDPQRKSVCVEGTITMQTDERGNTHILHDLLKTRPIQAGYRNYSY
jgi:hypothetical protein